MPELAEPNILTVSRYWNVANFCPLVVNLYNRFTTNGQKFVNLLYNKL